MFLCHQIVVTYTDPSGNIFYFASFFLCVCRLAYKYRQFVAWSISKFIGRPGLWSMLGLNIISNCDIKDPRHVFDGLIVLHCLCVHNPKLVESVDRLGGKWSSSILKWTSFALFVASKQKMYSDFVPPYGITKKCIFRRYYKPESHVEYVRKRDWNNKKKYIITFLVGIAAKELRRWMNENLFSCNVKK